MLRRYAHDLADHESRLFVITTSDRVMDQMAAGGLIAEIGEGAVYRGTEWLGETTRRAHRDAGEWIRSA